MTKEKGGSGSCHVCGTRNAKDVYRDEAGFWLLACDNPNCSVGYTKQDSRYLGLFYNAMMEKKNAACRPDLFHDRYHSAFEGVIVD